MILQELIRNFILYRQVLRPLLDSWKQSFVTGYYREFSNLSSSDLNLILNKAKALDDGEELGWDISDEYEAKSLIQTSGTLTITNVKTFGMNDFDVVSQTKNTLESISSGREMRIVLMDDLVDEKAAMIGKTYINPQVVAADILIPSSPKTMSATTGYESIQINSFLNLETHEKREYLGEFSLTHEETPLPLFFKEGGDYHDIDQESITAIV